VKVMIQSIKPIPVSIALLLALFYSTGKSTGESAGPEILCIGDSFMETLHPLLSSMLSTETPVAFEPLSPDAGDEDFHALVRKTAQLPSVEILVISYGSDRFLSNSATPNTVPDYLYQIRTLLNTLSASGKKIIWTTLPPPPKNHSTEAEKIIEVNHHARNLANNRKCFILDIHEYIRLRQQDLQTDASALLNTTGLNLLAGYTAGYLLDIISEGKRKDLPYVLLMGDSISNGYNIPVRELLKGRANVRQLGSGFSCPVNWENLLLSIQAQEKKQEAPFAVIHFNWGLHALKYIDAQGKITAVAQGTRCVPPDKYPRELARAFDTLAKTEAIIVWASTTPEHNVAWAEPGDSALYNELALEVAAERKIPINDLFCAVEPTFFVNENDCHLSFEGSQALAQKISETILKHLPPLRTKLKSEAEDSNSSTPPSQSGFPGWIFGGFGFPGKRRKKTPQVRKGFTLIELLVVVAILGILLPITFNAIGFMQKKAKSIKNSANLRELHRGMIDVITQGSPGKKRGFFPGYAGSNDRGIRYTWTLLVAEALGYAQETNDGFILLQSIQNTPLNNPFRTAPPVFSDNNRDYHGMADNSHYAYNVHLGSFSSHNWRDTNPLYGHVALSAIQNPASTIVITESDGDGLFDCMGHARWAPPGRNDDPDHALCIFVDGHIETLSREKILSHPSKFLYPY